MWIFLIKLDDSLLWAKARVFAFILNIGGLVQDCSNSIANALELLQSCTKPPIYGTYNKYNFEYAAYGIRWWPLDTCIHGGYIEDKNVKEIELVQMR